MFDLKWFRKENNLSQVQLAKALGIAQSFVSAMETGKDPIPESLPYKLKELYGIEDIARFERADATSFDANNSDASLVSDAFRQYNHASGREVAGGKVDISNTNPQTEEEMNAERFDRLLDALERRDQLAILQQKEYEKQGSRIDELISLLKNQITGNGE